MAETITIRNAELFRAGRHPNGDVVSVADLKGMTIAATEVGFVPPLKLAPAPGAAPALLKAEAAPAVGWVTNLRVRGERLLGDLCEVPPHVAALLRNRVVKKLGVEVYHHFAQGNRTWPRVLRGVTLSGADLPVGSLRDVERLYGASAEAMRAYAVPVIHGRSAVKVYQGAVAVVAQPGVRLTDKGAVAYRESNDPRVRCGTCHSYLGSAAPGAWGACGLVVGEIAADAVCDRHEVREAFAFGEPEAYAASEFDGAGEVGAGVRREQEEVEMEHAEQTEIVGTDTVDAEVMARVRTYQLRDRDPDLWRRYGEKTYARLLPRVDDQAECRRTAGNELASRAKARAAQDNLDYSTAFRLEASAAPELTRAYLGMP